jgi:hypothetical protein
MAAIEGRGSAARKLNKAMMARPAAAGALARASAGGAVNNTRPPAAAGLTARAHRARHHAKREYQRAQREPASAAYLMAGRVGRGEAA